MKKILFSALKNEGPFILEWVAYHRAIGFDDIVIVSNDCTDGSEELLSALHRSGAIRHLPNDLRGPLSPQMQAESLARSMGLFSDGDYVMWLDLDEFLVPPSGAPSVDALVAEMKSRKIDALFLNWRIMGDSGQDGLPDGFVLDGFTGTSKRFFRLNSPVKTLFRYSSAIQQLHLHRPIWKKDRTEDICLIGGNGQQLGNEYFTTFFRDGSPKGGVLPRRGMSRMGRVNHYCIRTKQLYALKKARGLGFFGTHSGTVPDRYTDSFLERFNQNVAQSTEILVYRDALLREHSNLMRDADVAAAHLHTVSLTLRSLPERLAKVA